MKLLIIDNFDSFTYNLYQAFRIIGPEVCVRRNNSDELTDKFILGFSGIIISPGPGRPPDAGRSKDIIARFGKRRPILGVCLGMQCINEVLGGTTVKAPVPVHGKTSVIHHSKTELYKGIPSPFSAARYHSLIIHEHDSLEVTAWTEDTIPMSVKVPDMKVWGVQYHPESFLTPDGPRLLENFTELCLQ